MLPYGALAVRAHHILALVFTEWMAIGFGFAALVWMVRARLGTARARDGVLTLASIALLIWFVSTPLAAAWLAYVVIFYAAVELAVSYAAVAVLVLALLAVLLVLPVLTVGPIGEYGRHAREFVAFATNVAFLRLLAYAADRRAGRQARPSLGRFLLVMFFFPTVVNGPIEAPRRFAEGWSGEHGQARRDDLLAGLARVAVGVGKLWLVGVALRPGWMSEAAGLRAAPAYALWSRGILLYVWFYLSFSAWTDVAVGLARLCGRRAQENFFAPWQAVDPADFWRRWHVSLGLWLRDYVYIPLGGKRRHRALNVFVVFAVSAAWHVWGSAKLLGLGFFPPNAWGGFFVWGALNALGVLAVGPVERMLPATTPWAVAVRRFGTFLFASLCWVPFFMPPELPFNAGLEMLLRMLLPFRS